MAVGLLAWCGVNARQPPNRGSSHSRVSEARWWNSPVGVLIARACHASPVAVGLLSWCWPWVCAPAPRQFMAVGLLAWCGVNARQPPNRGSSHSLVSEARWWNSPVGVLITRACHASPVAVGLLSWCWPWVCAPAPRQFMAVGLLAWCGVNARQPPNRGSSHSHVSEARWWNSPVGVLITRACHDSPVAVGLLSWCWPWVCAPAPRQFMAVGLLAWCGVNARQPPNRGSSHSHVSEARWWNSPVGVLITRACHDSPVAVGLLSWCWPWVCAPAPRQFMAVGLLAWCGVNARQPPNRGSSHSHVSEARWWNSPVGVLITRACHASPVAVGLLSWCWPWVCAPAPRQFMAVGLLAWCGVNARQPPNRGSSHSHVSEARWWNSPVGVLITRACHDSPAAVGLLSWCWPWVCAPAPRQFMAVGLLAWCGVNARQPPNRGSSHSHVSEARWWNSPVGVLIARACHASPVAEAQSAEPA